jgi:WD40 repeat protein
VGCITLDESANLLYSGSDDGTVKVWNLQTYMCVHTLRYHSNWVSTLVHSPVTKRLYSGSYDGTIVAWDTIFYECVGVFQNHHEWIFSLCLSPDGSRLYSGSRDHIKVWDATSFIYLKTLEGDLQLASSLQCSKRFNLLISSTGDKAIRVWDTTTNTCIHTVTDAHVDPLTCVAISHSRDIVYSASYDKTIKVWQMKHTW